MLSVRILLPFLLLCLGFFQESAAGEPLTLSDNTSQYVTSGETSHAHVEALSDTSRIPPPLEEYQRYERENNITGVWNILKSRAKQTPFNVVATVIFLLAVLHTFLAGPISKYAHKLEVRHTERIKREGRTAEAKPFANAKDDVSVPAKVLHLLGEVEVIFGIWLVPLMLAVVCFYSFKDFAAFVDYKVDYKEAVFVVIIMAMAHTRPVVRFAERCLRFLARRLGTNSPAAW
jgi:hypothetical protein